MKRFNFPLERVRRWRLEQLTLEELKLGQVRAERQALADAKQVVHDELAQSERQVLAQRSLLGLELQSLGFFRGHTRDRIRDLENLERQSEVRVEEQRQRVLEARRQFELLDGLRGKALKKWHVAADREQETLAAELYLAKSTRNISRS